MHYGILTEILVLLAGSVVAVVAFRHFRLPSILAYLCVGVIIGPHGLALMANGENMHLLAEFGVVFLLFTVGLEFSLAQLVAMRREVLGIGGLQVLSATLVVGLIGWWMGLSPEAAIALGGIFAMSSTAIVIKQLSEQVELDSRHGRTAVGVLLFQDIAVVPFLIFVPAAVGVGSGNLTWELTQALLQGIAIVALMLAAGHWLLRPVFTFITAYRSAELFTLTILLLTLAAAWLTHLFGLSLALGAFVAGMMLGETEFKHQVEVDIRPFRDVLLGLFFVTIGMVLDIGVVVGNLHWILLLLVAISAFKIISIIGIARWFGLSQDAALRSGLVLGQGGEFGLALLMLALSSGLFSQELAQLVVATLVLSMVIAPFLITHNQWLAKRLVADSYTQSLATDMGDVALSAGGLHDHVIICGYGRTGQNVARILATQGFEYVALDMNALIVREAKAAGDRVSYGDSTHSEILMAAGLERARSMVISYNDDAAAEKILSHTRAIRPDLPVLVRTTNDSGLERLQQAGATEVVPDTLEAALMLASHVLFILKVPVSEILKSIQSIRSSRYAMLREFFHGQTTNSLSTEASFRERLHSVTLPPNAYAVGKRIDQLALSQLSVDVSALRRRGIRGENPASDTLLLEGDTLVLVGNQENLLRAESLLLQGAP